MATAMASALTRIPVHKEVAMTGEITLRGKVLPIGGLKEKLLAAHRAGLTTVVIPKDNEKDLIEVPADVRDAMQLNLVETMDEVLHLALERLPIPRAGKSAGAEVGGQIPDVGGQMTGFGDQQSAI
jgi:ATP-dependent Lon protease